LYDATVYGTVTSLDADATYRFDYGTTTTYGQTSVPGTVKKGSIKTGVSANLTGLACGTTYHYQFVVNNGSNVISGGDRTFMTEYCPPVLVTTSSTTSSFVYNRASGNFGGSLIVTNNGPTPITGTLGVFIKDLPAGIRLNKATSSTGETLVVGTNINWLNRSGLPYDLWYLPYIEVPLTAPLQPGKTTTLQVQFYNPANIQLTFSTDTYRQ
jgi:hypothetical protein